MFINEFIPSEDVEKYRLAETDEKFVMGGTRSRQWTIDRDRDIYLRNVAFGGGGDPDIRNQHRWTFYWRGYELTARLDLLEGRGGVGEPGWSHWLLVWLNGSNGLPAPLKPHAQEILTDLEAALLVYKDFGVRSTNTDYSITLDIDPECAL